MSDHRRFLQERSNRGTSRGADQVLAAARLDPRSVPKLASFFVNRPWTATAISFVAVLSVGALVGSLIADQGGGSHPVATTPSGQPCQEPPPEAGTRVLPGSDFEMVATPVEVVAGEAAVLELRGTSSSSTSARATPITFWQCWNGDDWENVFNLVKGVDEIEAAVRPWNAWEADFAVLALPVEATLLIPEVAPGTYRLSEHIHTGTRGNHLWTIVRVIDPAAPPHTTTPPDDAAQCETPPDQELRGGSMPAAISPAAASVGDTVDLTLALPTLHEEQGDQLHVDEFIWSCWDGSRWVHLDRLVVSGPSGPILTADQVAQTRHHRIILPATMPLKVPDVEPALYRIWFIARMNLDGGVLSAHGQTYIEVIPGDTGD